MSGNVTQRRTALTPSDGGSRTNKIKVVGLLAVEQGMHIVGQRHEPRCAFRFERGLVQVTLGEVGFEIG
jgi:hypothetical protein